MTSKLEQMTYKMQPAGHEAPQPRRKYSEPDRRISELFEAWLMGRLSAKSPLAEYEAVTEGIMQLQKTGWQPSINEAHALLLKYQDHPNLDHMGVFISAIYKLQSEEYIVFDVDLNKKPIALGFYLDRNKTLIACSPTAYDLGFFSSGTILNYSTPGPNIGGHGLFVNYGRMDGFNGNSQSATFVNLGTNDVRATQGDFYEIDYTNCESIKQSCLEEATYERLLWDDKLLGRNRMLIKNNLILDHLKKDTKKTMPELADYLRKLKELLEPGKNDYKEAIKILENCKQNFGKTLRIKISEDLGACFSGRVDYV